MQGQRMRLNRQRSPCKPRSVGVYAVRPTINSDEAYNRRTRKALNYSRVHNKHASIADTPKEPAPGSVLSLPLSLSPSLRLEEENYSTNNNNKQQPTEIPVITPWIQLLFCVDGGENVSIRPTFAHTYPSLLVRKKTTSNKNAPEEDYFAFLTETHTHSPSQYCHRDCLPPLETPPWTLRNSASKSPVAVAVAAAVELLPLWLPHLQPPRRRRPTPHPPPPAPTRTGARRPHPSPRRRPSHAHQSRRRPQQVHRRRPIVRVLEQPLLQLRLRHRHRLREPRHRYSLSPLRSPTRPHPARPAPQPPLVLSHRPGYRQETPRRRHHHHHQCWRCRPSRGRPRPLNLREMESAGRRRRRQRS